MEAKQLLSEFPPLKMYQFPSNNVYGNRSNSNFLIRTRIHYALWPEADSFITAESTKWHLVGLFVLSDMKEL